MSKQPKQYKCPRCLTCFFFSCDMEGKQCPLCAHKEKLPDDKLVEVKRHE